MINIILPGLVVALSFYMAFLLVRNEVTKWTEDIKSLNAWIVNLNEEIYQKWRANDWL